jgi:hypothetical protein
MKLKSILAAAFVLMSAVTFANDSNSNKLVVIRGQESGIFKVIFEGKDQVSATVSVLDVTGKVVFTETINGKNGFILPMNFKGLKAGEYTIEVKQGGNTLVETITYAAYTRTVEPSTIQNVHLAKLSNNGKYLLSVTKSGNEPITISVFNTKNELVHFETRKAEGDFAVVYDITAIPGVSKFEITGNAGYSAVIRK